MSNTGDNQITQQIIEDEIISDLRDGDNDEVDIKNTKLSSHEQRERAIAKRLFPQLNEVPEYAWEIKGANYHDYEHEENFVRLLRKAKGHENTALNIRGAIIDIENEIILIQPVGEEIKMQYSSLNIQKFTIKDTVIFGDEGNFIYTGDQQYVGPNSRPVYRKKQQTMLASTSMLISVEDKIIGHYDIPPTLKNQMRVYSFIKINPNNVRIKYMGEEKAVQMNNDKVYNMIVDTKNKTVIINEAEAEYNMINTLVPNKEGNITFKDTNGKLHELHEDEYDITPYLEGLMVRRFRYSNKKGVTMSFFATYRNLFADKTFKVQVSFNPKEASRQQTFKEIHRNLNGPSDDELFYIDPTYVHGRRISDETKSSVYYYEFLYVCDEYTKCSRRDIGAGIIILIDIKKLGGKSSSERVMMPKIFTEKQGDTLTTSTLSKFISPEVTTGRGLLGNRITVFPGIEYKFTKTKDMSESEDEPESKRRITLWKEKDVSDTQYKKVIEAFDQLKIKGLEEHVYGGLAGKSEKIKDKRLGEGDAVAIRRRDKAGNIVQIYLVMSESYAWRRKMREYGERGVNTNILAVLFQIFENFKRDLYSKETNISKYIKQYPIIDSGTSSNSIAFKNMEGDILLDSGKLISLMTHKLGGISEDYVVRSIYPYQIFVENTQIIETQDMINNLFLCILVSMSPYYQRIIMHYDYFSIVNTSMTVIVNYIDNKLFKTNGSKQGDFLNPVPLNTGKDMILEYLVADVDAMATAEKNEKLEKYIHIISKPNATIFRLFTKIHYELNSSRDKQILPAQRNQIIREALIECLQKKHEYVLYQLWLQAHYFEAVPSSMGGRLIFAYDANNTSMNKYISEKLQPYVKKITRQHSFRPTFRRGRGRSTNTSGRQSFSSTSSSRYGSRSTSRYNSQSSDSSRSPSRDSRK